MLKNKISAKDIKKPKIEENENSIKISHSEVVTKYIADSHKDEVIMLITNKILQALRNKIFFNIKESNDYLIISGTVEIIKPAEWWGEKKC